MPDAGLGVEFEWLADEGPEEFIDALNVFQATLQSEIEKAAERVIEQIHDDVEELAPVDTGKLRDSYETEVEAVLEAMIEARVTTDVEYAPYQEFMDIGTPHVGPALEKNKDVFEDEAETAWNNTVRKVQT